jgi:nucleoside-diphosphate-sugar epimerase
MTTAARPNQGRPRALLTGATGFIGSHCVAPLLCRGYEVVASYNSHPPATIEGVRWIKADLLSSSGIGSLLEQAQASHLLHLAWFVEPGKLIGDASNLAWCGAGTELLRRFHEIGGKRCVIGGSGYEYDWRYGYCNERLTPRQPDTLYGAAKLALCEMALRYCESVGMSAAWGRMFFLYGPNEHPRRLVPAIIQSLLKGDPALSSHGKQIRDYAHVQDVADGLVALLDSSAFGAYNIASGQATSILSIVTLLGEITGRSDLLRIGAIPARANDAPLVVADVSAAKRDFSWEASIPLAQGLETTVNWWRSRIAAPAERQR